MPKYKDNFLDGILYCLHSQGKTASETHSELQKLTGEDPMTLEKIELLFKSIKKKNFSLIELTLEEKIQMSFQIPSVQKRILANADLKSRLALCETSQLFRQLSLNHPFVINVLTIEYTEEMQILAGKYKIRFKNPEHEAGNRLKYLLSSILRFKRLTVDVLEVFVRSEMQKDFILARMEEVFEPLGKESIHVKKFCIDTPTPLDFLGFIRYFDPKHFKLISPEELNGDPTDVESVEVSDILSEVLQSDAWKRTPSFRSLVGECGFGFLNHCCHFSYCRVFLTEIVTVEKLMKLKEKLLVNHQLRTFKIIVCLQRDKLNEIRGGFGLQNAAWKNLSHTEEEKLLIRVTHKLIWFRGPRYAGKDEEEERESDEESGEEDIWSEESDDELDEENEEDENDEEDN